MNNLKHNTPNTKAQGPKTLNRPKRPNPNRSAQPSRPRRPRRPRSPAWLLVAPWPPHGAVLARACHHLEPHHRGVAARPRWCPWRASTAPHLRICRDAREPKPHTIGHHHTELPSNRTPHTLILLQGGPKGSAITHKQIKYNPLQRSSGSQPDPQTDSKRT